MSFRSLKIRVIELLWDFVKNEWRRILLAMLIGIVVPFTIISSEATDVVDIMCVLKSITYYFIILPFVYLSLIVSWAIMKKNNFSSPKTATFIITVIVSLSVYIGIDGFVSEKIGYSSFERKEGLRQDNLEESYLGEVVTGKVTEVKYQKEVTEFNEFAGENVTYPEHHIVNIIQNNGEGESFYLGSTVNYHDIKVGRTYSFYVDFGGDAPLSYITGIK